MRKLISAIGICAAFTANAQSDNPMSASLNDFSFSAYKQVAEAKKNENFVFSPLSVNLALRMTEAGAKGKTLDEIAEVVSKAEDQTTVDKNVAMLMNSFADEGDYKLKIANAVWIQNGYKLQTDYTDNLKDNYKATAQNVDFIKNKNRKATCNTINKWVADETAGMIKKLIQPNSTNRNTRLVLTNAIYFKCYWQSQFRSSNNRMRNFRSVDGSTAETNFMKQTEHFKYFEDSTLQIISLPYSTDRFQMFFILPSENNFSNVEQELCSDSLMDIMRKMEEQLVEVVIPKFKIETNVDFTTLLKQMGINEAFSNYADFSSMTSENNLKISQVLHKAVIEVEEKGTEAAAATSVTMGLKSAYLPKLKHFIADKPFIYFIWDEGNRTMIFAGRYVMVQ